MCGDDSGSSDDILSQSESQQGQESTARAIKPIQLEEKDAFSAIIAQHLEMISRTPHPLFEMTRRDA